MNSFELRQRRRNQVRKLAHESHSFEKALETAGVQSFFEDAFTALYNRKPQLRVEGGWFYLQGKRLSKEALMQRARVLYAKLNEQENTDE